MKGNLADNADPSKLIYIKPGAMKIEYTSSKWVKFGENGP